jgi:hypothetical protein
MAKITEKSVLVQSTKLRFGLITSALKLASAFLATYFYAEQKSSSQRAQKTNGTAL